MKPARPKMRDLTVATTALGTKVHAKNPRWLGPWTLCGCQARAVDDQRRFAHVLASERCYQCEVRTDRKTRGER